MLLLLQHLQRFGLRKVFDFLDPLKPFCPADAHEITFPFVSAIDTIVLLNVDWTYAIPLRIFF